jgi:hypothetical protein
MKRQLFRYLQAGVLAIALFTNVNAQVAKATLELNLKEFIYSEAQANLAAANRNNAANMRASRDLIKRFNDPEKVNWFDMTDGLAARFVSNEVDTKAFYDRAGRWYATVRSYGEDKLPSDIRRIVKSSYYDYSIYLVDEVTVEDTTAFLVRIQDRDSIKTIRIINGEMDVFEKFMKRR